MTSSGIRSIGNTSRARPAQSNDFEGADTLAEELTEALDDDKVDEEAENDAAPLATTPDEEDGARRKNDRSVDVLADANAEDVDDGTDGSDAPRAFALLASAVKSPTVAARSNLAGAEAIFLPALELSVSGKSGDGGDGERGCSNALASSVSGPQCTHTQRS